MLSLYEIRRRKMFQVTAAYTVVAWLLVEVITTIKEPLSLPHWSDTLVIVLLALGFPLLLTVSWFFNVTTDGLVRDTGSATEKTNSRFRIEWILLGLVLFNVGWLVYRTEVAIQPLAGEAPRNEAVQDSTTHSLAVLPFEILNPDSGNDHFAASMTGAGSFTATNIPSGMGLPMSCWNH